MIELIIIGVASVIIVAIVIVFCVESIRYNFKGKKVVKEGETEPKICNECGHIFEFGGVKKDVGGLYSSISLGFYPIFPSFYEANMEEDKQKKKDITNGWFCSQHIPAWDKRRGDTYYKEFEVDEKGKIVKKK